MSDAPLPPADADPGALASGVLVRRAQAGESSARDELVRRYLAPVRRMVHVRLGTRLRGYLESEDVVQDAFVAALGSLAGYEPREDAGFVCWMSRIVAHQVSSSAKHHHAQKRDRRRDVALDPGEPSGAGRWEPADDATLPDDRLAAEERREALRAALQSLPEELRELIYARDYAGASWEEVARQSGCPSADAARMRHVRARAALLAQLQRRGIGPAE